MQTTAFSVSFLRPDQVASESSTWDLLIGVLAGLTCYSLTGADTVIFYDSDFNPQMDRQCEDR